MVLYPSMKYGKPPLKEFIRIEGGPMMRQMMKKPVSKLRTVFAVKEAYSGLLLFFRAFRAWRKGDYPLFPKKTILLAALAFIYVLSPIDLIPDVLAGVGWLDDAAVLAFLFRQITKELDGFETYLTGRVNYNGKQ